MFLTCKAENGTILTHCFNIQLENIFGNARYSMQLQLLYNENVT
jgi:hypothetical protein